jgi:threonine dehydratase
MNAFQTNVDAGTIAAAADRIAGFAHRTPVLTCSTLDLRSGARLFFKCENFQKVGAFKFRGALNAVRSLQPEEARKGVATHSSGNHAQALALAARMNAIPAYIVMPDNAPSVKKNAVLDYGARVVECAPTLESRESTLGMVVRETGAHVVHPYNDERVIAGQATCALELLQEVPGLDALVAPVGGGGLLSGTILSARYHSPQTAVWAAEPLGADDAWRSLQAGQILPSVQPRTIADGLLTSLGDKTFPIIRQGVKEILRVDDGQIVAAMHLIWERMKIVVEPSSAVALAAVFAHPEVFSGKRVGILLSGGNVDLRKLPF